MKIKREEKEGLKPCPFCGKSVAVLTNCHELEACKKAIMDDETEECMPCSRCEDYADMFVAVVCDYSKGGCGATVGWALSDEKAMERWNRRIEL